MAATYRIQAYLPGDRYLAGVGPDGMEGYLDRDLVWSPCFPNFVAAACAKYDYRRYEVEHLVDEDGARKLQLEMPEG